MNKQTMKIISRRKLTEEEGNGFNFERVVDYGDGKLRTQYSYDDRNWVDFKDNSMTELVRPSTGTAPDDSSQD